MLALARTDPLGRFVDYYALLQVSASSDLETIERVYKMLDARCEAEGNMERRRKLRQAYAVLSDPAQRRSYDAEYQRCAAEPIALFQKKEFAPGIDGEPNRRLGLLYLLYQRRRANPEKAGLPLLKLEMLTSTAREHLLFPLWYLKERSWIKQDEASDYLITGSGVEYFEESLVTHPAFRSLLKSAEEGVVEGP